MANSNRRYRQYVGLALVIVAYVGGIIGWSWAALSVDSAPTTSDAVNARVEVPPTFPDTES